MLILRALLALELFLLHVWNSEQRQECESQYGSSGIIFYESADHLLQFSKCWYIDTPEDSFVRLKLLSFDLNDPYCESQYILISGDEQHKICQNDNVLKRNWTKTLIDDVNITLYVEHKYSYLSFALQYNIENFICGRKDHFRCSENYCIHKYQECDGKIDCDNGTDEMDCDRDAIKAANNSRENAIRWLRSRQVNFGWGKYTHQVIIAFYLTEATDFHGSKLEEELMMKQLELQIMKSLLRNSTNHMSLNELSMYINALSVTCLSYRNFYGYDLLKILAERAFSTDLPSPGAYITLCNADWKFSKANVLQMLEFLTKDEEYPFVVEFRAITVMALYCIKQRSRIFQDLHNATQIYEKSIENLMKKQQPDGSFGNAHTTAIVAQALLSSGKTTSKHWNSNTTMNFLMHSINSSSVDFLSIYLTLPIFRNKTLVDIGDVDCSKSQRKVSDDDEIVDVMNKLGDKVHVQYSLYIGDKKDVIHTLYLRVPENSTVVDVMRVAEVEDLKYKFSYIEIENHVYIYKLAGKSNDIEAGTFWFSYKVNPHVDKTNELHFSESPDSIIVENKEHLIMWYKTAYELV